MQDVPKIHPVILSGGVGARLWPMSRALYPKQLMPLASERTMLQDTVLRVSGKSFAAPLIVCNEEYRFIVAEQMRGIDVTPANILLEPVGRNTGPAAAVAAMVIAARDPDAVMLVTPSDHVILKPGKFREALGIAATAARAGALVTFGIRPDRPETGYGYILHGAACDDAQGCYKVVRFVEKPDLATAEGFLAEGEYLWNSGIFAFTARTFLTELERYQPEMVAFCRDALAGASRDLDFCRLDSAAFKEVPFLSIDYALMEHTTAAAVVPVEMGWNDIGSWSALWDTGDRDEDGNVLHGDVLAMDVRNSYIRSDGLLTAVVGLDDLVIVVTSDAALVVHKDRTQDVKEVVDELKRRGRHQQERHLTIHRPWGQYRSIDGGERFQVKHITVQPGGKLSLQMHHHRTEHWIVVHGTARVTRGNDTFLLHENHSTYIPLGVLHRLENPGKVPLWLIEVQSGSYLGEDDIVRVEDNYGRS
ncbi:MAG: mannose-1-phosphate guanylyltransferase/mannose-6-phosphate isomerase [Alphaproteobacteria bacterium]|nr:mannose-1-phosphate guanylyltransferase/mannose-6-phosphate isomerase [Alphaproteobacteria bacterium]